MRLLNSGWLTLLLLTACAVGPAESVDRRPPPQGRHPNLNSAYRHCQAAVEDLSQAQRANEGELAGHAARAKRLLEEAMGEIEQAQNAAGDNDRR